MQIAKKIVNAFLAITLLIATTGVTLSKHYCMGRLKSIAINEHAEQCFPGEQEKMPCCEDVDQELKVEEITKVSFHFDFYPDLHAISISTFAVPQLYWKATNLNEASVFYPPPSPIFSIYARHQAFLI